MFPNAAHLPRNTKHCTASPRCMCAVCRRGGRKVAPRADIVPLPLAASLAHKIMSLRTRNYANSRNDPESMTIGGFTGRLSKLSVACCVMFLIMYAAPLARAIPVIDLSNDPSASLEAIPVIDLSNEDAKVGGLPPTRDPVEVLPPAPRDCITCCPEVVGTPCQSKTFINPVWTSTARGCICRG